MSIPTIIVTGPVGVGKSTVAEAMGYQLPKIPHANVDFDQLTACYPRPADDDVWGSKLGLANLAAIWRNYERAGARRLIIARVVESRSDLDGYRQAVPGADIVLVRLRASLETLQSRLRGRGPWRDMEWHLKRAAELAAQLDAQPIEDLLIETDDRDAVTVARDVLRSAGGCPPEAHRSRRARDRRACMGARARSPRRAARSPRRLAVQCEHDRLPV